FDLEGDLWLEPDSTESCDQRFLAGSILPDLETPDESPLMVDPGVNRPRYLRDGRLMLGCEGLQERGLHHPVQPRKPESILGEGVVLHDPAVFAAVQRDDREVGLVQEFRTVDRLPTPRVLGDPGIKPLERESERDVVAVAAMMTAPRPDVVAEGPSEPGPGVGDQGLLGGQCEPEVLAQ